MDIIYVDHPGPPKKYAVIDVFHLDGTITSNRVELEPRYRPSKRIILEPSVGPAGHE